MKKLMTILNLLLMSSTVFASKLECQIRVTDTSKIGRNENGKAVVVKEAQTSQSLGKDGADVAYSLPSDEWHGYATIYLFAYADENGKITSATVSDEIKNISVPMAVSSDGKKAQLSYSHGGVLADKIYETLDIDAVCEIK